jgi:hypothetical protein
MIFALLALGLQDEPRTIVQKAFENVRGPRVTAEVRLEREGVEEDWVRCEQWEKAQKAGVWNKSYFKGSRRDGGAIEWYEVNDVQRDPRRTIFFKKGDGWEKVKPDKHDTYLEFQAVRSRLPDMAKIKLDTLQADDWTKVLTEKKDKKIRVTFPEVDAKIGELIGYFYPPEDEAHDFIIDRSKLSVVLEIEEASGRLLGAACTTHYASRDGKKNFTIRCACQFSELDPKQKLPE